MNYDEQDVQAFADRIAELHVDLARAVNAAPLDSPFITRVAGAAMLVEKARESIERQSYRDIRGG